MVLGREMASAIEAERSLRARHPGLDSPLGVQYDVLAGEFDLLRFVPSDVDEVVAAFVAGVARMEPSEIDPVRASLTMDDLYTLLNFIKRQSVTALRQSDQGPAASALVAGALIDIDRVDWRDVPVALALPMYALTRLGDDFRGAVLRACDLAQDKVTSLMKDLAGHTWSEDELAEWLYLEVPTAEGPGFVMRGIDRWEPTVDLLDAVTDIANLIDQDSYQTSSISVGESLPAVWFPKEHREEVERIVSGSPAIAKISTRARQSTGRDPEALQFTCFVAELEPRDVERLVEWSDRNLDGFHAALAVGHGRLLVLFVARSFVKGVPGIETPQSLQRFGAPVLAVLQSKHQ